MPTSRPAADVSIISSGHDVADARLHRETAALQRAGLTVEVLALGDPGNAPPGALVRTRARRHGIRRALSALALPWQAHGKVVIAVDPDGTAAAMLRRALTGRRVRVVADVHEDYTAVLRDRAWAKGLRGVAGRVLARLGSAAARRADLLVVADEHLMPARDRRLVLRNLPDLAMLPASCERQGPPRAIYVGDLRRSRGLFTMLDTLAAAPSWTLDLVGPVATSDLPEVKARLADERLAGRVRLHGRQPPREAWALAEGAWAGLLMLEDTPAFRAAVPSKLYEYLACGLGVVTTDLPRAAAIVRDSGAGVVVSGPDQAAEQLERWAARPADLDALRAAALRASEELASADELAHFAAAVSVLARR